MPAPQCAGNTVQGRRCLKHPTPNTAYCHIHRIQETQPRTPTPVPRPRRRTTTTTPRPSATSRDESPATTTTQVSTCNGTARNGRRCTRLTAARNKYCFDHQPAAAAPAKKKSPSRQSSAPVCRTPRRSVGFEPRQRSSSSASLALPLALFPIEELRREILRRVEAGEVVWGSEEGEDSEEEEDGYEYN